MNSGRLLRISVIDEGVQSPRIGDEESISEFPWRTTPRPLQISTIGLPSPGPVQRHNSLSKNHPIRIRRSSSPQSRGEAVMEKIMNPYLDRNDFCSPKAVPPPVLEGHNDSSHFVKASAFDDDYHSVYVAEYPGGLRGLFILFQSPILLMAIGCFAAFIGLFVDFWLAKIAEYHNLLSDWGFKYFLTSALFAAGFATILTHLVCPQAAGSGLPFMKVAISGVDMAEYLSLKCIITKIIGLVAVYNAGLSIGKEGPFIMISCGFASVLMSLPMFHRINNDETKRLEMLACACAAGVAATFGSPFGGVLFGVEVTSHFYLVRTLPRSFFTSIIGALFVNFVTQNTRYGLFGTSNLGISEVGDNHTFTPRDLSVFILIGIACGLGGAGFNFLISILVRLRDRYLAQSVSTSNQWTQFLFSGLGKRLLLVTLVTLISCITEFYGDSAWFIRHGSPRRILAALFSKEKHVFNSNDNDQSILTEDSVLLSRSLITYLPLKFLLTLVSVILPVPAGLFTPTFVIGGIFGRLIGEAIKAYGLLDTQYEPFEFAIIGAGAFSSGVTHAISTAVIIMEISHSDGLNLPVSIAILASYFTAKRFTDNVYDLLISTSNMPRLKKLPKAAYDIPSWEVMRDVGYMNFLTADSTYSDAVQILERSKDPIFAIVDSYENLFLLATVTRRRLMNAVEYGQQKMKNVAETTAHTLTPLLSNTNDTRYGGTDAQSRLETDTIVPLPNVNILDWPIHFAFRRGGKVMDWGTNQVCARTKLTVLINPSPFQLMEMTPMKRVDLLFRMLKLNNVYITRSGRLVGVITRDRLMTFLGKTRRYKVPGVWDTLTRSCGRLVQSHCEEEHESRHHEEVA